MNEISMDLSPVINFIASLTILQWLYCYIGTTLLIGTLAIRNAIKNETEHDEKIIKVKNDEEYNTFIATIILTIIFSSIWIPFWLIYKIGTVGLVRKIKIEN